MYKHRYINGYINIRDSRKDMSLNDDMAGWVNGVFKTFGEPCILDMSHLYATAAQVMQLVEQTSGLDGKQKKEVVILVLLKMNEEWNDADASLQNIINTTIPFFVDQLISVDNGALIINTSTLSFLKKVVRRLCMCC